MVVNSTSLVDTPASVKAEVKSMFWMVASPGVATVLPFKSATVLIPLFLPATMELPSIWAPDTTFTGTPWEMEDITGVIPA